MQGKEPDDQLKFTKEEDILDILDIILQLNVKLERWLVLRVRVRSMNDEQPSDQIHDGFFLTGVFFSLTGLSPIYHYVSQCHSIDQHERGE